LRQGKEPASTRPIIAVRSQNYDAWKRTFVHLCPRARAVEVLGHCRLTTPGKKIKQKRDTIGVPALRFEKTKNRLFMARAMSTAHQIKYVSPKP